MIFLVAMLTHLLACGSTRSGKTWAELKRLVEAAMAGVALVVIDPHRDSLATPLLAHLVARGLKHRIIFERLADVHRVLSWDLLPRSTSKDPFVRDAENEVNKRAFADILCRRQQTDLATSPSKEEWLLNLLSFYIEQIERVSLTDMTFGFAPGTAQLRRLIDNCGKQSIADQFRAIDRGIVRPAQYAASARLFRGVCDTHAFAVRCSTDPRFNVGSILDRRGIVVLEGGGASLPEDAMRAMMGAAILQTIQYVRTRPRPTPPVILVVEEATNANLISASGFETRALAECAKMGLSIHILVQLLNFPTAAITDAVLANTLRHEWYFNANAAIRKRAAIDLGDREAAGAIANFTVGWRYVKDRNRVYREYVEPADDPWGYEGLAKRKAERALLEIQQRPEYHTPKLPASEFNYDDGPDHDAPPEDDNPQVGI